MPADPQRNELDQIINSGLASYVSAEPWPGFEQRILSRLSPKLNRRRMWLWWAVPVPMLAAALMLVILLSNGKPIPKRPELAPQIAVAPVNSAPEPVRQAARFRLRRTVRNRGPLPKAPTFPAPASLSEEERALAKLAASDPKVLETAIAAREHLSDPITVEPIRIPLLENGQSLED